MELFKLLGTIAIDSSEANKELDNTSKKGSETQSKLSKTFSGIGKGAAVVGKAVATGMAVAGAGVATLTTKAIQSYADYEQLVGGVDTLFKNASSKVQSYAANAYKTAGMSANEYMETVTSFSASLLQSLDGDTTKAAEKANMAITDMSDNANKMGTDISMIQNAYNGFAKQNYTMLDNLKLGYGGTQEEMKRLLKDAEKLSGQKFDISSYGDVVDAIHVIQTEMGITGTTAKEASSTISGSIASMKGSWQNLLTAISSDDLPFDDYVNAFVDSVSTVAQNLLPRIKIALNGIVTLVQELAPIIIAEIPGLVSTLLPSIIEAATSLIDAIVEVLPQLVDAIVNAVPLFIEGFVQIFNSLVSALPQLIETLVLALPTLIPQLIDGLVSMIVILCTMMPQIIQPIIDNLPLIMVTIVNALLENLPALIQGVVVLITGLAQAIPQLWGALREAVKGIFDSLLSHFAEWFSPITDWFKSAWDKLTEIVSKVFNTIKNVISVAFKFIGSIISGAIQIITLPFRFIWENCKEYVFAAFEWIKSKIKIAVNFIKDIVALGFKVVQEKIITPITNAKNKVVEVFNNIKSKISDVVNGIKSKVSSVFDSIKSKISNVVNSIKSTVTNVFNKVKSSIEKPINTAKETVKKGLDAIKGFFDKLKLKFPKIKMPHFSVKGKFSLDPPSVPKLSIDWYKKAMNNPMIMNDPTIFGYNPKSGSFMGGGEAGSEVVSGTNTLMGMIRSAVSGEIGALAYYMQQMVAMLSDYFPQVLELQAAGHVIDIDGKRTAKILAKPMDAELGKIHKDKERGQ